MELYVLILCQRKTGTNSFGEDITIEMIPTLERSIQLFLDPNHIHLIHFEYLTNLNKLDGNACYKFEFGENKESECFIEQNKDKYTAVVMQTCPFMLMSKTIPLINKILNEDGLLIMTAIQDKKDNLFLQPHIIKRIFGQVSNEGQLEHAINIFFNKTEYDGVFKKKKKKYEGKKKKKSKRKRIHKKSKKY